MPHVQHAAPGFADHRECFYQNLVQRFLQRVVLLLLHPLDAVEIILAIFRVCRRFTCSGRIPVAPSHPAQPFLDALPELVRFGAQFLVRELLHLGLERVDGLYVGHQRLDNALVLRPKNLA